MPQTATVDEDGSRVWVNAEQIPYKDPSGVLSDFRERLDMVAAEPHALESHYARLLPIVQSSGAGKTRLMKE